MTDVANKRAAASTFSSRMYHNSMMFHSIHYIRGSCNANLMENGLLSKCPSFTGIINESRWIWEGITGTTVI